ncbi:MAG TPA: hypothetical protein VNQ73_00055 [Ilumatobacter sp.]|nr:hypothetical protein [Ilumatobacter sp.]
MPGAARHSTTGRRVGRRVVFAGVLVLQAFFVVRAYWAPHNELGFQMFPEASQWQAEVVRVTADGERVPVGEPWSGYVWSELVTERGLGHLGGRRHANNGLASQVAFLEDAMAWVAANTPADYDTRYYEATVTEWHNADPPVTYVLRSPERELPTDG